MVIIFEEHHISMPYKVCVIIFAKLPLYVDETFDVPTQQRYAPRTGPKLRFHLAQIRDKWGGGGGLM
jgi:hypothetical protein